MLVSSSFFGRNTRSATADIPTVPSFIAPALVACRKGKQLIDVLFNIFRASYLNFTAFPSSLPLPDPPIAFYGKIPIRIPIEPYPIAALKIKEVSLAELMTKKYYSFVLVPSYQKFHCLPLIPAPPRPSHPVLRKNSNTTIPNCCSKSKGGEFGRICVKKNYYFASAPPSYQNSSAFPTEAYPCASNLILIFSSDNHGHLYVCR